MFEFITKNLPANKKKAERERLIKEIHSRLKMRESLLQTQGYRTTTYNSEPTNPDNTLAKSGAQVDRVLSSFDSKLDESLLETLRENYDSVVFVGIVKKRGTDEFDSVIDVDILDPNALGSAQLTVYNNRNYFTTQKVLVKDKTR